MNVILCARPLERSAKSQNGSAHRTCVVEIIMNAQIFEISVKMHSFEDCNDTI